MSTPKHLHIHFHRYDTLYRVDELTPRRKQELKEVRLPEDTLHLPPSNPFIPASLDLTPAQPEGTRRKACICIFMC